jgi:hypothetical protein
MSSVRFSQIGTPISLSRHRWHFWEGMSPFDKLPDELISRIFTIGCELDMESEEGSWVQLLSEKARQALRERNTPTPTAFAATSLSVCRRWYTIARARSNRHLWIIFANFNRQGWDTPPPGRDDWSSLANFKNRLSSSNGCNIYARYWSLPVSNATELALEICFAVLFITLIKRHHLQVDSLYVWASHQITSLILRLVNNIGVCFQPHILTVIGVDPDYSSSQMEFEELASTAASLYSIELFPGSTWDDNSGYEVKSRYSDTRYIEFDVGDDCKPIAMSLIQGQLREIGLRTIYITLADLQILMICCPALKLLEATVAGRPTLDSPIFSGPMVVRRRGMQTLILFAECKIVSWILQIFELPHLRTLKIGGGLPSRSTVPDFSFPSLRAIDPPDSIVGRDFRSISSIRLPGLQDLEIGSIPRQEWEMLAPMFSESHSLSKLFLSQFVRSHDADETSLNGYQHEAILQVSPPSLSLWDCSDVESIFTMLRSVDLTRTHHLQIEVPRTSVPFPYGLNNWCVNMPALSSLKIESNLLVRAIEFALELRLYLRCPRLRNVKISRYTGEHVSLSFVDDQDSESTISSSRVKAQKLEINFESNPNDSTVVQIVSAFRHYGSFSNEATELKISFMRPANPLRELLNIVALLRQLDAVGHRVLPNLKHVYIHIDSIKTRLLSKDSIGFLGIQGLVEERRRHGCPLDEFLLSIDKETYIFQ